MEGKDMKLSDSTFRLMAAMTGLLLMSIFGTAKAAVVEGFESGTFNGSEAAVGDAGITTSFFGINATEGTHQLLLTTINNTHDEPGYSHQFADAVSNATLASFFGVSGSLIRDGAAVSQEGSGFSIDLGTLTAGSTISFDWNFLTNEIQPDAHNDFSYYTLTGLSGVTVIADTNSALLHPTSGAGNPFALETGYQTGFQTLTININTTGSYVLGLGVSDATTTDNPSGLLIDNLQVSPVPEPTTIGFSIAGAALLVALRSRIKRTS
jgi:hypothetical protein